MKLERRKKMNQEKIGKFIAKCRKEKKLTQEEFAEKLGVNNRSVSRWENGQNMPDLSLFKPLCEVLDITINELMSGEKIKIEDYQEKFEENIINTINYSNNQKLEVNKKLSIMLIVFGYLMTIISGFYAKPGFLLSQLYLIASICIIIICTNKLIKKLTVLKKILINIGCILIILFTLTGLDYVHLNNGETPYFAYYKEINDNVEIYKTIPANIYIVNTNNFWDKYYIIDYSRKYTKETIPISPFNRNLAGIDNLSKYEDSSIKDNIIEVIKSLPLGYRTEVKDKSDLDEKYFISNLSITTYEYDEENQKMIINYVYNPFYSTDDLYVEKALIYNTISLSLVFKDLKIIESNYNGKKYVTTKEIIENNYPYYSKIVDKKIDKDNFNIYLEKSLNYNEFVKEIFNKLFEEN